MSIFKTHREKILLLFGSVLILLAGFFSGYSYSQEQVTKQDIIVQNPDESCTDFFSANSETVSNPQVKGDSGANAENSEQKQGTGLFVASKNSTIYHKADCAIVKRINEENKIFFNSAKEAEASGLKLHAGE